MKLRILTFLALAALHCGHATAMIIDEINPDGLPVQVGDGGWNVENIGWFYTPTFSYVLQGVNTLFGPDVRGALPRTVTLEVFDTRGGTLLRTADFSAAANTFSGATFADLFLTANEDYFIGFRNVTDLQANVSFTGSPTTSLIGFGNFSGQPDYSVEIPVGAETRPILQFIGSEPNRVPAPATLALLGLGFLGLARRRNA